MGLLGERQSKSAVPKGTTQTLPPDPHLRTTFHIKGTHFSVEFGIFLLANRGEAIGEI
jgi:hypothetical protein